MIGRRLAHFEIQELLGRGGMGEVYRAVDSKLGREVALKILPPEFSQDAERSARLAREARTLASLSHGNIAAIHGFEEDGEHRFLIMELAAGEDLSIRLARGALTPEEAIAIAIEVAAGLEAAHEQNIVHRDLKPANIKIDAQGKVKILDFGLARAYQPEPSGAEDPAMSPTITAAMTAAGTILGTAAYMSPEQARGKAIDKRADIWAFGVILVEMLTGERVFAGETISDTLADVLRAPIDLDKLPASTPAHVRHVLDRCLERDPRRRLRDIGEAKLALSDPSISGPMQQVDLPAERARMLWPAVVAVLLIAGSFLLGRMSGGPEGSATRVEGQPLVANVIAPGETKFHLLGADPGPVAISPDGRYAAYSGDDGVVRLWVHDLETGKSRDLPGTERAQYPFWSPDGRKIGYFARGEMFWISRSGGPPVAICPAFDGKGATWNRDNVIVFTTDANLGLSWVSAEGGEIHQLTSLQEPEKAFSHRHPRFLPDGRHFTFVARAYGGGDTAVMLGSLDSGTIRMMFHNASQAEYASGHLLYVKDAVLLARSFDLDSFELHGDPIPLSEGVRTIPGAVVACFSASRDGRLILQEGKQSTDVRYRRVAPDGTRTVLPGAPVKDRGSFSFSPDNRSIAETIGDPLMGAADIWLLDLDRGVRRRIYSSPDHKNNVLFLPDRSGLLFAGVTSVGNVFGVNRVALEPNAEAEEVFALEFDVAPKSVSADGKWVLCEVQTIENGYDIWAVSLEDPNQSRALLQGPYDEQAPAWSPDGKWLSYATREADAWQVFIQDFPAGKYRIRVSPDRGTTSKWKPDGSGLCYITQATTIMFVPIDFESGAPQIGEAIALADLKDHQFGRESAFALTNDGSIVYSAWEGEVYENRMQLLDNWPEMLRAAR